MAPRPALSFRLKASFAANNGGSRDLLAFYDFVIAEIRKVDPVTPIMADAGWRYWEAIDANGPDPVKRKATRGFEPIRKRLQP